MDNQTNLTGMQSEDLEYVVRVVRDHLNAYDIQATPVNIRFYYINSDNPDIDNAFDEIRKELVPKGFIPFLSEEGEHFLEVTRRPSVKFRGVYLNIIMLILTLASTIYVGSIYAVNFVANPRDIYTRILYGFVFFSLPLMLILGIHETGHFIVARCHKVRSSLPFFIPFPLTLGTFGAFISLRDPLPNRRAMTEIGIAGPIAGFLTALPLVFIANSLSHAFPPLHDFRIGFFINFPLIYRVLHLNEPHGVPVFPMVLAVWVGMFATAMNLIPVGQLDGGHVVRGLLGKRASIVDYIFVAFLFILGFRYRGWWLLAIFVVLLGLTHPPALDDYAPVKPVDIALGVAALIMFILTFTAVPIGIR